MQVSSAAPLREYEKPMSWARAVLIAIGFFFLAAMLAGQLPSYMYTVSTLSTLAKFEQGTLDLALLAVGFGVLALEISFLYDPRPLIPWPLFALVGLGIAAVGTFFVYQVTIGLGGTGLFGQGWYEFLPGTIRNPAGAVTGYWPSGTFYLFHPAWFQADSIDIAGVGYIATLIGLGMFLFAVLNPFVLRGTLTAGPWRDLIVRFSIGLSFVLIALYLTLLTFVPSALQPVGDTRSGPIGNIVLFAALGAALIGLQVWLLPVMVANRQRFMPATYLHGVVGLLGMVGVPLLVIWAAVYPVVNLIHQVDPDQIWVQCSQKTVIPGSCTFTQFTGYIICAIVFTLTFGLLILGLYFWSTRRDTVILGGTFGIVYLALAATVIHVDDPRQLPLGMILATSIVLMGFVWTWGTQREFAPTTASPLGCTGQWLVLGTLLLVYLFGFSVFSLPSFFETEALALFYNPGPHLLHDAFWGLLLMGGLALFQMVLLIRRQALSDLRKFAMWVLLVAVGLQMVGAIQGFHRDVLASGIDAMEGSHAIFLTGIVFEVIGIAICLYGAFMNASSLRWALVIAIPVLICLGFGIVVYNLPTAYPELIVMAFIAAMVGAFAYVAAGPDYPAELAQPAGGENGSAESFVVTR
ncbi:MAG TPA: hypothetical protein VFU88_02170 [Ktedonobacterales bacterium]|nr:hypothetical protein [Ktedonobacterales bacterium]